ncbi:beta-galactosidase 3-like isoform X2 [Rosa rugosa]|uniref:beta-galactosidase 3-like isoform X2 n=1 Tax=Rosa rugosa TaxID=74645 RepID=UPI002B402228|nr:beta-galactosidase 3-like isoform X2 [Rosa rugosa]XP_062026200.1 beta-galactosidase 3-like isoform X2 [Rosa rugosa]
MELNFYRNYHVCRNYIPFIQWSPWIFQRICFCPNNIFSPLHNVACLPDCEIVVFNIAKVELQTSQKQFFPTNSELWSWETFSEDISSWTGDTTLTVIGFLDQLNITIDPNDYLRYTTR